MIRNPISSASWVVILINLKWKVLVGLLHQILSSRWVLRKDLDEFALCFVACKVSLYVLF